MRDWLTRTFARLAAQAAAEYSRAIRETVNDRENERALMWNLGLDRLRVETSRAVADLDRSYRLVKERANAAEIECAKAQDAVKSLTAKSDAYSRVLDSVLEDVERLKIRARVK